MAYYKICEYCEAHLDPNERCNCRDDIGSAVKTEPERCTLRTVIAVDTEFEERSKSGNYRIAPPRLSVNAGR